MKKKRERRKKKDKDYLLKMLNRDKIKRKKIRKWKNK